MTCIVCDATPREKSDWTAADFHLNHCTCRPKEKKMKRRLAIAVLIACVVIFLGCLASVMGIAPTVGLVVFCALVIWAATVVLS